jgi:hypothetical protein
MVYVFAFKAVTVVSELTAGFITVRAITPLFRF